MRRDKLLKKTQTNETKKAKNKTKKVVVAIIIILIIAIFVVIIKNLITKEEDVEEETESSLTLFNTTLGDYVKETSSGIKINTSTALNEKKQIDGLDITEIQLTQQNGVTTLLATVTNNTSESTSLKNVNITFIDEDGNELVTAAGVILGLEVGASTQLNVALSANYVQAYNFTISTK